MGWLWKERTDRLWHLPPSQAELWTLRDFGCCSKWVIIVSCVQGFSAIEKYDLCGFLSLATVIAAFRWLVVVWCCILICTLLEKSLLKWSLLLFTLLLPPKMKCDVSSILSILPNLKYTYLIDMIVFFGLMARFLVWAKCHTACKQDACTKNCSLFKTSLRSCVHVSWLFSHPVVNRLPHVYSCKYKWAMVPTKLSVHKGKAKVVADTS